MLIPTVMNSAVLSLALSTVPDCSLNGVLNAQGTGCVCDKPWTGPVCSVIAFKPVTFPQGYGMEPKAAPWHIPGNGSFTTWGGNSIEDPATGKFHLFVSAMTNECPLQTWGQNSRIDHAVADSVVGPYSFVDIAIPTWSHNAAPVVLHDGTFAIFHIGDGTGTPTGGKNCTPSGPGPAPPAPTGPCTSTVAGWTCGSHVCAGDPSHSGAGDVVDCGADLGEPNLDCDANDEAACSAAAAKVCAATPNCAAFGLSAKWSQMMKAKLFSASKVLVSNADWSVWSKTASPLLIVPAAAGDDMNAAAGGSTIHISASLNGPWLPLLNNTLGGCNNPAPWVHQNGTLYCLCSNSVKRATNIWGPWETISTLSHSGGPVGNYEDPFL